MIIIDSEKGKMDSDGVWTIREVEFRPLRMIVYKRTTCLYEDTGLRSGFDALRSVKPR